MRFGCGRWYDPGVETLEIAIVGGGSAGLATAALLQRAGRRPVVLEAGGEPGAAWRDRYDRLHLHTPRLLSGLPGLRIPRRYGRWIGRDDLIDYLADYVEKHGIDLRTGTRVTRIDAEGDAWRLDTEQGALRARTVIVATGYNGTPFIPDWPGRDGFTGELIHSSQYRNPEPYRGRDVLVVGAGNSGAEIAHDVVDGGARSSKLSVRTPPQIVRRATAGIPAQLLGMAIRRMPPDWVDPFTKAQRRIAIPDLSAQGLPRPEHGVRTAFITTGTTPILDVGIVDAVRRGRVQIVAAVEALDGRDVVLADGARVTPDAVIAATGFRAGLDGLVGHLDVLGPRGLPSKTDGEPARKGLWFVGFTPTLGGQLREGSIAAAKVASAVAAS
ncbi:MAG: putative flavoprotein involved in transport [Gaiellaceae bacterium]|nr:putative flavoprotein involved in transport [Gaiellaceae bacterium]